MDHTQHIAQAIAAVRAAQAETELQFAELIMTLRAVDSALTQGDRMEAGRLLTAATDAACDLLDGDAVAELFEILGLDDGAEEPVSP